MDLTTGEIVAAGITMASALGMAFVFECHREGIDLSPPDLSDSLFFMDPSYVIPEMAHRVQQSQLDFQTLKSELKSDMPIDDIATQVFGEPTGKWAEFQMMLDEVLLGAFKRAVVTKDDVRINNP